jgi:hypothetical protein
MLNERGHEQALTRLEKSRICKKGARAVRSRICKLCGGKDEARQGFCGLRLGACRPGAQEGRMRGELWVLPLGILSEYEVRRGKMNLQFKANEENQDRAQCGQNEAGGMIAFVCRARSAGVMRSAE